MPAHSMTRRTAVLGLVLTGFGAWLAGGSHLVAAQTSKPAVFTDFSSKLALDGHDPVAYFTVGKPVKGVAEHTVAWNGATWRFSSAANKSAFEKEPAKYAPQFGGYCAWAVSEGYTAKGDPSAWRIVDGKLYVNYNAAVQKTWEKDVPGHVKKGDANWPKVLRK